MLKGMDKVDEERMLPLVGHSRTRGHCLRIRGSKFKTELRRNYFSQRVVNLWNSLPQSAVDAGTVSKFKELDRFLIGNGLKGHRVRVIEVYSMETGPSAQLVHAALFF